MSMLTIRPMTEADDIRVSEIMTDCVRLMAEPDGLMLEQRDRMIEARCKPAHMAITRDRFTCHDAEQDGRIVGFIAASRSNIEELFVAPACHRRGVATALFRQVEADCRNALLTVGTTGFGIPFYEAMGMHVTGARVVTFGPFKGRALIQLDKKLLNERDGG